MTPPTGDPTSYVGAHRAPRLLGPVAIVVAVLIAAAVIGGLFVAGLFAGGATDARPAPTASLTTPATPVATTTPTPSAASPVPATASGPLAAGPHAWSDLQGGECLTGYTDPWAEEFTVADCAAEHTAQLVTTGLFTADPAVPYPGEAALVAQLNLLCTAPAVLDYGLAGQYPDLAWQSSYPTDEAQWAAGDHRYFCFYARSGGAPLVGSLQAPPVAPAG